MKEKRGVVIKLSVNVNKIALLRNSRETSVPSVVEFSRLALEAGAHGITVHPRPDLRHITPEDVYQIADLMKQYPDAEFNIEGNPFEPPNEAYPGYLKLVSDCLPDQATLVPDSTNQKTSDHGWNFDADEHRLRPTIEEIHVCGVRSSVFVDPLEAAIQGANRVGANRIELYTESYAKACVQGQAEQSFDGFNHCAKLAHSLGLGINAGHDLNQDNLLLFASLSYLEEVSIGHALVVDALYSGFEQTVKAYLDALM